MFHHCQKQMKAFQCNQSDSFVPSVVRNSHSVSRELKVIMTIYFYGVGRKWVSYWNVASSPRAWEPKLCFILQMKRV